MLLSDLQLVERPSGEPPNRPLRAFTEEAEEDREHPGFIHSSPVGLHIVLAEFIKPEDSSKANSPALRWLVLHW